MELAQNWWKPLISIDDFGICWYMFNWYKTRPFSVELSWTYWTPILVRDFKCVPSTSHWGEETASWFTSGSGAREGSTLRWLAAKIRLTKHKNPKFSLDKIHADLQEARFFTKSLSSNFLRFHRGSAPGQGGADGDNLQCMICHRMVWKVLNSFFTLKHVANSDES